MIALTVEIRKRLRSARKSAGVSQQDAAWALGLKAQPNIQRIESTKNSDNPARQHISRQHISKLAELYGCSEEFLLGQAPTGSVDLNHSSECAVVSAHAPAQPEVTPIDTPNHGDKINLNKILRSSYPENYLKELSGAMELKLTGLNLRRIDFTHIADLKQVLDRQGKIKVLLLTPGCKACKYAAIQDRGPKPNIKNYIGTIREMLAELCKLKRGSNGKNIEIRTIDYALTFGLDIIDAEKESGVIYVRNYPLYSQHTKDDKPILRLSPSDSPWYDFYRDQFDLHWDMAEKWRCSYDGSLKQPRKRRKRRRS